MTVRLATRADEEQLVLLCRALQNDNAMFKMDEELVRKMLHHVFNRQGIIGVIDHDGKIAGAILLTFSHFWYSKEVFLEELFCYVKAEYRRSNYARQLLEFMKECQRTLNLPLVTGIVTNKRTEAKVMLYRKKLGTPAGAFFVLGGHWENEDARPCDDLWVRHSRGRDNRKRIIEAIVPATMTTLPLPIMPITNGGGS